MPTENDYRAAMESQTASNLAAIVKRFADIMPRIVAESRRTGNGSEYVNNHPIARLFAEQIYQLAGNSPYIAASLDCERMANAMRDQINLDGMEASELRDYSRQDCRPKQLRDYAYNKAQAMECRLAGNIQQAQRHERVCDSIYSQLVKGLQW